MNTNYPFKPNRPDLDLLKLALKHIYLLETGLCHMIDEMWLESFISLPERHRLSDIISQNRPEKKKSRFYWWNLGEKQPRVEFLQSLITKLESETN